MTMDWIVGILLFICALFLAAIFDGAGRSGALFAVHP